MASYDLQRLGGVGFQDVVSALAIKVLGAHVRPMGRGRDGGRDMLVSDSVIVWSADELQPDAETWTGTTVFQIKHKETLAGPKKDASTLWQSIHEELDAWADPESSRGKVPDYLVFATNVRLTPVPEAGGFDWVNAKIQQFLDGLDDETAEEPLEKSRQKSARDRRHARRDRMAKLRKWRLWDGNQINGLLDAHEGVRRAFDGFLTAGDVLAELSMISTNVTQEQLGPALRDHARTRLLAERRVHFDEAGGETKGVPVEEVAIDLPVLVGEPPTSDRVIGYVLDRGERILKPSVTSIQKPRHLVITGAPGNGKSTVAKFLTHAYRTTFVGEDTDLGEEHRKTAERTQGALRQMGVRVPANRRWPINIDLAKFALRQVVNSEYSLMRWIAEGLTQETASKDIPRWELKQWLRRWPSFIVLDGLDEVTEPSVRQTLISNIEAFVADAESNDCDMLVVVTTRPTGYRDEMPPSMFERINLADLTLDDALRYGRLVTGVRVADDTERRDGIITLLESAARDENLRHLLRTPLQTLIMSIIAESSGQFSPSRFKLFWGYYQTIEQREQKKAFAHGRLLRDHAHQVLDLHLRVGLLLQRQAETASGTDAVLTFEELKGVAWQVLDDAGYEPSTGDRQLLEKVLAAATNRLVLLVPQAGGGYGFDVRSLQELMAAYALTTGTLEETIPKLRRIGASPHWRNTLLFALGRYFAEPQPHQKQEATDLVLTLDENAPERLGSVFPVGPNLAMEILDDGMVSEPKYQRQLVPHAMKALAEPEGYDRHSYPRMLMSVAATSESARALVADGLRDALGGSPVARKNAEEVQQAIGDLGRATGARAAVLGLATVLRDPAKALPVEPVADWDAFSETLRSYSEPGTEDSLDWVRSDFEAAQARMTLLDEEIKDLEHLLEDPDNAFILDEALRHIAPGSPLLLAVLRYNLLPGLWRRPVDLGDD